MLAIRAWIITVCLAFAAAQEETPPSITAQADKHIYIGNTSDTIVLPCAATGQPTYKWLFNNNELNTNKENIEFDPTKGTLTLHRVTGDDDGYYQCVAENTLGTAMTDVTFLQKQFLGPVDAPGAAQHYSATKGDKLEVTCNPVFSVPEAVYSWVRTNTDGSDPVRVGVRHLRRTIDENGNLLFANLDVSDSTDDGKQYMCEHYNPVLDMTVYNSPSTLHVEEGAAHIKPPSIMAYTGSPAVGLLGQDVKLLCFFESNPEVSEEWAPEVGQLPLGRHEYLNSKTVLQIKNLQMEDEGDYKCTGTLQEHPPASASIQLKIEAPPTFKSKPVDTDAKAGTTVTFKCETDAIPAAEVQWFKNTEPINVNSPDSGMTFNTNGTQMTIERVTSSDTMVVHCNASNVHGYAFGRGYLHVVGDSGSRPQTTMVLWGFIAITLSASFLTTRVL